MRPDINERKAPAGTGGGERMIRTDLGKLDYYVPSVADDLGSDLDQFLP